MKLFISWSGSLSKQVALSLRNWLPKILHDIEPFVSSEDIDKGKLWNEEIIKYAQECKFAIVCVTRFNFSSKWLNFEAGALSKYNNINGHVCPFYYDMQNVTFSGPLAQFQSIVHDDNPEEFSLLIKSIRDAYGYKNPSDDTINGLVLKLYDDLKKELDDIPKIETKDYSLRSESMITEDPDTLFISSPISSLNGQSELTANNKIINLAVDTIETHYKFNYIKSPARSIVSFDDFDDNENAVVEALKNIQKCEYFLCFYTSKVTSSTLVEMGYAISKGKKVVIVVKDRSDLPFLLQEADKRIKDLKIYVVKDFSEIDKFLVKWKNGLFNFQRF